MNKEQVSGTVDDLKGKAKEEVGKVTGDHSTQASGLKDQVKGKVEKAYGDAKEAIHDADKKAGTDA
jgi:uncharacterized protein YjbJ (UPF0337 family)